MTQPRPRKSNSYTLPGSLWGTVVLCMIVKDETPVIRRAIASVLPHIDAWAVVDTGSTDGTQALVRDLLGHLPGELAEMPWIDFASCRNSALGLAGRYGGRALILDADDELEVVDLQAFADPAADVWWATVVHAGSTYRRPHMVRIGEGATWKGVVHEFLELPDHFIHADAPWRIVNHGGQGARSKDPLKYIHDADTISKALTVETDQLMRNRYCFYLAQSYRDAAHSGAAIYWYTVVAENEGQWSEERYIAMLDLGRLTDKPEWFMRAAIVNPKRAEAWRALGLHGIADRCSIDPSWLFVETAAYGAVL